jgi:hypothetical protein
MRPSMSGDRRWEGNALCNLGVLQHMQGALDRARRPSFKRCRLHARSAPSGRGRDARHLGLVDVSAGQLEAAGLRYEEALRVARRIGDRRAEGQFLGYLGLAAGAATANRRSHRDLSSGESIP